MFNRKEWLYKWKQKNIEKLKAQGRALYHKNRDKLRERAHKYYECNKDPIKQKAKALHLRWGLTLTERERLITIRKSKCDICNEIAKLEIDHDHKTSKIRGLLCGRCNRGLGLLQDSIAILDGAKLYLQFQMIHQIDSEFLPLIVKKQNGN